MAFTTAAFMESVDPGGVFNALTAVPDQHLTVTGDDLRVPILNQVVAAAGGVEDAAASRLRLVSPSLRVRSNFLLTPFNAGNAIPVPVLNPPRGVDLRGSPLVLTLGENLNAEIDSNPLAAQVQWCIVWLADGPITPVGGPIFTVRATATPTGVVGAWVNGALTFIEDLPRGKYAVYGMRAMATNLITARLVFVGGTGWRPGCLAATTSSNMDLPIFRYGGMGTWGEFEDIEPPTVDFLYNTAGASTPDVFLDLIQVRSGPA